MGLDLSPASQQVLLAFGLYLVGVMVFGVVSHRYLSRTSFVKDYFVGGRGLGAWVLALTVAATAVSGGTFMGFPSLIYSNGWIMALWIASYMMVPLTAMALMGKRLNQVARISGAVTVPDVFRDRFACRGLGYASTLIILVLMLCNLVAQFKGGASVIKEALQLPRPAAELVDVDVSKGSLAILKFETPQGAAEQKCPFPTKDATLLRTQVLPEQREVQLVFSVTKESASQEISKRVPFPPAMVEIPVLGWKTEKGYLFGLLLFAFTVVAYTAYGGFWAVTWTDVFEGLVMLFGVFFLAILALQAVPGHAATGTTGLAAATEHLREQDPALVFGPGPEMFLPVGFAFSFFLMWSVTSPGQAGGMVRLMSFKDSASLRKAMVLIAFYYLVTYLALLVIFICARAIYPTEYLREMGSEGEPDSIMPVMARRVAPSPFIAGLLLAAPYAAIMSTVAAFILLISSSLVRDIYQRGINPNASERKIKLASYSITALVGIVVTIVALNPPQFLQLVIVLTGSGQGAAFLFPMLFAIYWRRSTWQGVLSGMLGGFFIVAGLYLLGIIDNRTQSQPDHWIRSLLGWLPDWGNKRLTTLSPLAPGGVDPVAWGLGTSLCLTVLVSYLTRPDQAQIDRYFPKE